MRNFIVVTKQEILMICLTYFFDAAWRRHNDASDTQCLVTTFLQQDSAPTHCAAHVQQLNCCVKKRQTFLPQLWPPNSPDVSPVDYEIWAVIRHRVYQRQVHSVDKLKRRLIDVWCGLEQSIIDEAIDQWRGRHRACVHAKGGHFEYSMWTDNADFVHICYVQCDLFDCFIFNYETMPQRWPIHSCSFYKVMH